MTLPRVAITATAVTDHTLTLTVSVFIMPQSESMYGSACVHGVQCVQVVHVHVRNNTEAADVSFTFVAVDIAVAVAVIGSQTVYFNGRFGQLCQL